MAKFNIKNVLAKYTSDVEGEQVINWADINKAIAGQANKDTEAAVKLAVTESSTTAIKEFMKNAGLDDVETGDQLKSHIKSLGADNEKHAKMLSKITKERDDFSKQFNESKTAFDELTTSAAVISKENTGYKNTEVLSGLNIKPNKLADAKIIINSLMDDDTDFTTAANNFVADKGRADYINSKNPGFSGNTQAQILNAGDDQGKMPGGDEDKGKRSGVFD